MQEFDRKRVQFLADSFMPEAWRPLSFFTDVLTILLGWLTLSITVWTRHSHGDRALSLSRVLLAWITMQFFGSAAWMAMGVMTALGMRSGGFGGWMLPSYSTAFLLMCGVAAWKNRQRAYYQHSRSFGVSRLMPVMQKLASFLPPEMRDAWLDERLDWWTYRVVEPALVWLLGWLIGKTLDPTMGLYMQISSAALWLEAHLAYSERKNRYYDHLDALLESNALQAMIEGKPAPQHAGVHAVPVPAQWLPAEPLDVAATVRETLGGAEIQPEVPQHGAVHPFAATVAATMQGAKTED